MRAKGICLSIGYKDYKRAVQNNVEPLNKKKPACQDKRYRCFFLSKEGVYSLINKSRKTKVKKQFLEWLESEVYSLAANRSTSNVNRIYKKDREAPKKFRANGYKTNKKNNKNKQIIDEAIKEATEDAEISYFGLSDYLKEDDSLAAKQSAHKCGLYNKVVTKYYNDIYSVNQDSHSMNK